jgi:alpha-L-fucosidase
MHSVFARWMKAALCAVVLLAGVRAQTPTPTPLRAPETPDQLDARMKGWREAKFGMFIHWGLYAIPADGEWHMRQKHQSMAEYRKFADEFNPVRFNAEEWAGIAQDAGMKYLVLTTKHHDGFAMFHSKASDYNIQDATPFKRDPLKELSEACPKHGLKLGTYYSILADWGHPGGGAGEPKWDKGQEGTYDEYLDQVAIPQVKELLSNYGPLSVLWFDNDGSHAATREQVERIADAVKLQPQIVVTPRLVGFPGDFETCEGHIPMQPPKGDWELCTRTNSNWGYTGAAARPIKTLLDELTEAWGKGGNVLLNVGPTKEGIIPPDSVQRLREIGLWMKKNGEAVYESTRGPFDYLPWGWTTRKKDVLYLLVQKWPDDGRVVLPGALTVDRAWIPAGCDKNPTVRVEGSRTVIQGPVVAPDPNVSVIALQVKGDIPLYRTLTLNCPVTASENPGGAQKTVNGGAGGDWRIPSASGWIQVDLGRPQTFSVLRFNTPYVNTEKVLLEIREGEAWKTVWSADKPKEKEFTVSFPPVTAQVMRLTVTADKPGVRVGILEVFPPL